MITIRSRVVTVSAVRVSLVLAAFLACQCQSPLPSDRPVPELLVVPAPDWKALDPQVREQLKGGQMELDLSDSTGPALGRLYGEQGKKYHAYNLQDAAEVCYLQARRLDPKDHRWAFYLGYLYRQQGELARGKVQLEAALELEPKEKEVELALAQLLLELGEIEAAERHFLRLRKERYNLAVVHLGLGRIDSRRGAQQEALQQFQQALRHGPNRWEIHYRLAQVYRALGKMEKARIHLDRPRTPALLASPLLGELQSTVTGSARLQSRAAKLIKAGFIPAAVSELEKALEADPQNAVARMTLGQALSRQDDPLGALRQYRLVLKIDPANYRALFLLGTILSQLGHDRPASLRYRQALGLRQGDPATHFNLANTLRRLGDFEQAEGHYRRMIDLSPGQIDARLALALTLIRLEKWPQTLYCLRQGLHLQPEDRRLRMTLSRVLATCPRRELRDGERAFEVASLLVKERNSAENLETLALALATLGRFEEAESYQRQALRRAGKNQLRRMAYHLRLFKSGKSAPRPWPLNGPLLSPRSARLVPLPIEDQQDPG